MSDNQCPYCGKLLLPEARCPYQPHVMAWGCDQAANWVRAGYASYMKEPVDAT